MSFLKHFSFLLVAYIDIHIFTVEKKAFMPMSLLNIRNMGHHLANIIKQLIHIELRQWLWLIFIDWIQAYIKMQEGGLRKKWKTKLKLVPWTGLDSEQK